MKLTAAICRFSLFVFTIALAFPATPADADILCQALGRRVGTVKVFYGPTATCPRNYTAVNLTTLGILSDNGEIIGPMGPQGPAGPQGPIGPVGPQGPGGGGGAHPGDGPVDFEFDGAGNTSGCYDQDLTDLCGDEDGCIIDVKMSHKTDPADKVRARRFHVYLEQPSISANKKEGISGYTVSETGAEWAFILGGASRYDIAQYQSDPAWFKMLNFRHGNCPGQNGSNGTPYSGADTYKFTFLTHPKIHTHVSVYDN